MDRIATIAPVTRYRQYCPIARTSEILAERWTPLIVRNLLFGAQTFTAIAGGVPHMSRSMLVKRLRELEDHGILWAVPKSNGQGSTYELTTAGAALAPVIAEMAAWAETWVDVLPEHHDPGFALWAWCRVQVCRDELPEGRTVVAFEFPDQPSRNRYFWMLVDSGGAELCYRDPGGEPALRVVAESSAFVEWHRGELRWRDALRNGAIVVDGDRRLAARLPTWNSHHPDLDAAG